MRSRRVGSRLPYTYSSHYMGISWPQTSGSRPIVIFHLLSEAALKFRASRMDLSNRLLGLPAYRSPGTVLKLSVLRWRLWPNRTASIPYRLYIYVGKIRSRRWLSVVYKMARQSRWHLWATHIPRHVQYGASLTSRCRLWSRLVVLRIWHLCIDWICLQLSVRIEPPFTHLYQVELVCRHRAILLCFYVMPYGYSSTVHWIFPQECGRVQ